MPTVAGDRVLHSGKKCYRYSMGSDVEMTAALAGLRSCVEKSCSKAEKLIASLDVADGLVKITLDLRKKKGDHSAKEIQALRKRVLDIQKRAKEAGASAADELCALEKCKKQWEKVTNLRTAAMHRQLETTLIILAALERLASQKKKKK